MSWKWSKRIEFLRIKSIRGYRNELLFTRAMDEDDNAWHVMDGDDEQEEVMFSFSYENIGAEEEDGDQAVDKNNDHEDNEKED
eukprot:11411337-Ditylum_brightwellii.AAC.1